MAEDSKIQWTKHTFSPWRGCSKVSTGCKSCYAETLSNRNPGTLGVWGPNGTRVVAAESQWKLPLKWDREAKAKGERHRVFCASLADVFEDWSGPMVNAQGKNLWVSPNTGRWVDADFKYMRTLLTMQDVRERLFKLIDATPSLDWLLLTKRPQNVLRMTHDTWCPPVPGHVSQNAGDGHAWKFPPNVWIGTSVEDQETADFRIPHMLKVPAKVRFLSCEPLLGPVDLTPWIPTQQEGQDFFDAMDDLCSRITGKPIPVPTKYSSLINWIIVGGESGTDARTCRVEWMRSLVQQCRDAGVACFVKQLGRSPVQERTLVLKDGEKVGDLIPLTTRIGKPLSDKKGGDPAEWPVDLRVREFPKVGGSDAA